MRIYAFWYISRTHISELTTISAQMILCIKKKNLIISCSVNQWLKFKKLTELHSFICPITHAKKEFWKKYCNKIYLNNIFTLISKEIQLCNYLNFEDVSVVPLSARPDRQGLESSLLQHPATFNFSSGVLEEKMKPEHKYLHPKGLRYTT